MITILDKATCRIDCGGEIGTGFFVNGNTIITAKHVIDKFISASGNAKDIIIDNLSNHSDKVTCTYIDHCDDAGVAMISIEGDYRNDNYLTLCASEIIEEESIKSYGYPNSEDGRLVGEPLTGKILRTISDSDETMHDVSINIDNFVQGTYGGFSGSPVMNKDKYITSFIINENIRYISAVSIKKVANFLRNQSIEVKQDYLTSFEEYKDSAFESHGPIEATCIGLSKKPLSTIAPQDILNSRKGDIFYPPKSDSLPKLIADIKLNKDLQDALWSGWLELLTYIEMLKGKYENFNHIQIEVTSEEISKRFKVFTSSKTIKTKLQINFFFSENKNYFDVARNYIHEAMQEHAVKQDTCNIFNSHKKHFGIQNLTSRDIVLNISDPENSGPSIPNARIGVLSLQNLRDRIINSTDITSAQLNLRERFKDALK
jgi:hypothetical protein